MKRWYGGGTALLTLFALGLVLAGPIASADAQDGTISLFNGKDLTNFYTYLGPPQKGAQPFGKNNDPEKVFTVHDGMIHVSGKVYGGLITEKEYANYHLIVEYKWGDQTWEPRKDRARDSGILLHCVGADGAASGVWMESIECQMIEGGTGDIILVGSKVRPSLTVEAERRLTVAAGKTVEQAYYKPGASPVVFKSGRVNWYARDPNWKDVKGFRGEHDLEKPIGEWNRLECICDGDKLTYILNGKVVNAATKASHTKGKILFQSEGAELFFRKIDLKPLVK
jgi:hypothetical protein